MPAPQQLAKSFFDTRCFSNDIVKDIIKKTGDNTSEKKRSWQVPSRFLF